MTGRATLQPFRGCTHSDRVGEPLSRVAFDNAGNRTDILTYHSDHFGSVRYMTDTSRNSMVDLEQKLSPDIEFLDPMSISTQNDVIMYFEYLNVITGVITGDKSKDSSIFGKSVKSLNLLR